jgi:DMSO/TMAO reductase YedYZ molybdopterin-dependent catalytic subunit
MTRVSIREEAPEQTASPRLGLTRRTQNVLAAAIGVLAALATLAVAELVAALMVSAGSPLLAVGSFVIDIVPPWFKDLAIALFGTGDKAALLTGLGILVFLLAVAIGILEYRAAPWGIVGLIAVGIVAVAAVLTRAGASIDDVLPTLLGVIIGIVVLRQLVPKLDNWADAAAVGHSLRLEGVSRRRFLIAAGVTGVASLAIGLGARALSVATTTANTVRRALVLPRPASAAPPIPAGAELDIDGITPLISSNDSFYRIDTALQVPVIDASTWSLRITGMVEREVTITFDELLALPLTEHAVTLMCVSNEIGGDLTGNAVWLGYPIRELLRQAVPLAGADMVLSRSEDGFTASTPLEVLLEQDRESLLAVGMNGEPLPLQHGFPVRMVVPGLYGYVSATKWVVELKVTRFADETAYWTDRGWSALGPVKTCSRIDVPRSGTRVAAGPVAIAGVAWAQHRGIRAVEVRVDGGPWQPARLAEAISADTWRQWVFEWNGTSGNHIVEARAIDTEGDEQSGTQVPVIPDGAEGYHTITVTVE